MDDSVYDLQYVIDKFTVDSEDYRNFCIERHQYNNFNLCKALLTISKEIQALKKEKDE